MNVLNKKLARAVRGARGQFLAVAVVIMVGIAIYISMTTASENMARAKDLFYRENNFADYYFHVIKAPQAVVRLIEDVPGVTKATGRIQKDVPVIKADGERATARLTSYPLPMDTEVNRLHLLTGRLFEKYPQGSGIEVLLDPQYAATNHLAPGDTVTVIAEGKQKFLTVTGTATSPEFIYPMKDAASMMPEPETFGIVMVPHNQAQQILDMSGQINQVVIKLAPGTDEKKVAEQVKVLLEPYGNLADYPRKQQLSDAILHMELEQLSAMAVFLPTIFLGIAALIQFVMLGRMVRAQRLQIGVMKALGYSNPSILLHYTGYALVAAVAGALLGSVLGVIFANLFSSVYAVFFNLPQAIGSINFKAIFYGFSLSVIVGTIAGLTASRGVISVNPAESMNPAPPKSSGRIFLERWSWLWHRFGISWKMSLRTINRNRFRSAVTLIGVVLAVAMLVVALFTRDIVDYMINRCYFEEQRYDYMLRFTTPVKETELFNITRLDGVIKAEPVFEIPVRIHFMELVREDLVLGLPPGVSLKKLYSPAGKIQDIPGEGLLISETTAKKLHAKPGDKVTVETLLGLGPSHLSEIKIAGVNRQLVGGCSAISLASANRLLQESSLISGAMLKTDTGQAALLEKKLNEMTGIASISSRQKELDSFNKKLGYMVYSITIMISFAVVLGFAIVYNSSIMSFTERKRELASLRVVGFTTGEVSGLLLKENLAQLALGVILGLPCGRFLAHAYINAVNTDLYTFQAVIYPVTYVLSALGGIIFIMIAYGLAVKGVKRLDLVEVLKTRD